MLEIVFTIILIPVAITAMLFTAAFGIGLFKAIFKKRDK
jgi:hypothetical protein